MEDSWSFPLHSGLLSEGKLRIDFFENSFVIKILKHRPVSFVWSSSVHHYQFISAEHWLLHVDVKTKKGFFWRGAARFTTACKIPSRLIDTNCTLFPPHVYLSFFLLMWQYSLSMVLSPMYYHTSLFNLLVKALVHQLLNFMCSS